MESKPDQADSSSFEEDLREFYITPSYLQVMSERVRFWDAELVEAQLRLFQANHPGYPELSEILEGELYRRELNEIKRAARGSDMKGLKKILGEYKGHRDKKEIIQTEILIREGKKKLPDDSQ